MDCTGATGIEPMDTGCSPAEHGGSENTVTEACHGQLLDNESDQREEGRTKSSAMYTPLTQTDHHATLTSTSLESHTTMEAVEPETVGHMLNTVSHQPADTDTTQTEENSTCDVPVVNVLHKTDDKERECSAVVNVLHKTDDKERECSTVVNVLHKTDDKERECSAVVNVLHKTDDKERECGWTGTTQDPADTADSGKEKDSESVEVGDGRSADTADSGKEKDSESVEVGDGRSADTADSGKEKDSESVEVGDGRSADTADSGKEKDSESVEVADGRSELVANPQVCEAGDQDTVDHNTNPADNEAFTRTTNVVVTVLTAGIVERCASTVDQRETAHAPNCVAASQEWKPDHVGIDSHTETTKPENTRDEIKVTAPQKEKHNETGMIDNQARVATIPEDINNPAGPSDKPTGKGEDSSDTAHRQLGTGGVTQAQVLEHNEETGGVTQAQVLEHSEETGGVIQAQVLEHNEETGGVTQAQVLEHNEETGGVTQAQVLEHNEETGGVTQAQVLEHNEETGGVTQAQVLVLNEESAVSSESASKSACTFGPVFGTMAIFVWMMILCMFQLVWNLLPSSFLQ